MVFMPQLRRYRSKEFEVATCDLKGRPRTINENSDVLVERHSRGGGAGREDGLAVPLALVRRKRRRRSAIGGGCREGINAGGNFSRRHDRGIKNMRVDLFH